MVVCYQPMTTKGPDIDTWPERTNACLKRHDAVLMNSGSELSEFTRRSCVAVVGDHEPGQRASWSGTGVLVQLADSEFMLTAGHCVKDAGSEPVIVALLQDPRIIRFEWPSRGYIYNDDGFDFGFFEIPVYDRKTLETKKVFIGPDRIQVANTQDLVSDDHFVISGFPRVLSQEPESGVEMFQHHVVATSCSGHRKAPLSKVPVPARLQLLDLAYDESAPRSDMMNPTGIIPDHLDLRGASGGACWKGCVVPDPEGWSVDRMKLVGIHTARAMADVEADGTQYVFARETLVGHHLALIARECPSVAAFIYERWPALRDWSLGEN